MSALTDWVIVRFEQIAPLTLKLYFADQTEQLINFEPILRGVWLRPLRDPAYFQQVKLNEAGNLEWPDGQDFNPEALHNWPVFAQLYIQDGQRAEDAENIFLKDKQPAGRSAQKKSVRVHKRRQRQSSPNPV